jgi:hypothetical protein
MENYIFGSSYSFRIPVHHSSLDLQHSKPVYVCIQNMKFKPARSQSVQSYVKCWDTPPFVDASVAAPRIMKGLAFC